MVLANNDIDDDKKCRQITGNFDCHADAAVRCRANRPVEHIQGFHWMLLDAATGPVPALYCPGGRQGHRNWWKTQNTNKTQFLASNYGANQSLIVYESFTPHNGPSTQLINATSCVKL